MRDSSNAGPSSTTHPSSAEPVSILAVDDLAANLLAVEAIVESLGHQLVGVRSGLEALHVASTREFAAIVLDVAMPGLDGLETLKRLRDTATAAATPVIFLTAHRFDPVMVRRAFELGAVDYLEKPVSSELLTGKLSSFISLFQQRRQISRQNELLRIKDRHISILANDLRAPLATAHASALQLRGHADFNVRVIGDRIARCTVELEQLTRDLLGSARDATAIRLKPTELELSSFVEELVDDFRATYPAIRFSTALSCHVSGLWDPARLRQALCNLLCSVIANGASAIAVKTSHDRERAAITIESAGSTLSAEQLELLESPHSVTALEPGTMGGLVVAKEIALAHGGELRAQADASRTRLSFSVPL